MSTSLLKSISLFAPSIWQQTVRHRGKFNIKMPRPRHEIPRYLEEITKPVLVREIPDPTERCLTARQSIAQNLKFSAENAIAFERFLVNYALDMIKKHPVMLICHKLDVDGEIFRRNRVEFKKLEVKTWNFNTLVMTMLIDQNPEYVNLRPIVANGLGKNLYMFTTEENLKKLLTLLRKMPHLNMLGGMINSKLYTRAGVQAYTNMNDIESERGQLVALLNSQLAAIPSTLSGPLEQLSLSLGQLAKGETTASDSSQQEN